MDAQSLTPAPRRGALTKGQTITLIGKLRGSEVAKAQCVIRYDNYYRGLAQYRPMR